MIMIAGSAWYLNDQVFVAKICLPESTTFLPENVTFPCGIMTFLP